MLEANILFVAGSVQTTLIAHAQAGSPHQRDSVEVLVPEKEEYELQIWDYTGRKIYTYSFYTDNLKEKCNFSSLISGLYHCIILSNNNIQHQQTITIIK